MDMICAIRYNNREDKMDQVLKRRTAYGLWKDSQKIAQPVGSPGIYAHTCAVSGLCPVSGPQQPKIPACSIVRGRYRMGKGEHRHP